MPACLICSSDVQPFISFGRMPIANGFLVPDQYADEYFFELKAGFCPSCTMVQLTELVDREKMFHENYAFFSSTSKLMGVHFRELAEWIKRTHLRSADPFVVELGSNDGILLQHFAADGTRHLGIEPSSNVADLARAKGINSVSRFFERELAQEILDEHGHADVIVGANVMCHIPYLHSVIEGIRLLLAPSGVLIFEDPYLGDIVEKTSYDQIYDEHAFYFSASSVSNAFGRHGLELVDVIHQDVHGGSMRYVLAHRNSRPASPNVAAQLERERAQGLDKPETYVHLRERIEASRDKLVRLLTDVRGRGKRVVGYAATSKSTTVINYCGLTPDLVEFISDTTPLKQGKFSPGMHIPVQPYERFSRPYPDYALLFAWNHAVEVMAKEQPFRASGGRWIVYVPDVEVIE